MSLIYRLALLDEDHLLQLVDSWIGSLALSVHVDSL